MSNILKAFNNHLLEFVDDLISVFPDDIDLKSLNELTQEANKIIERIVLNVF